MSLGLMKQKNTKLSRRSLHGDLDINVPPHHVILVAVVQANTEAQRDCAVSLSLSGAQAWRTAYTHAFVAKLYCNSIAIIGVG